jgi:CHAT domain-containing protein
LATLWAVVDKSTPLLMTEFYRLQKENPQMTKAESIQKVQNAFISGKLKPDAEYIKKLIEIFSKQNNAADKNKFVFNKDQPFAHPFFWSPFVLIGNWR